MIQSLIENKETFVLKFSAEWCGPCKSLASIINNIENKVKVVSVDIDSEEAVDLLAQYGVRNVPFMVAFKDGVQSGTMVGAKSKAEVEEFVSP